MNAGADLVNDVDGLRDDAMRRVVARTSAAVIVMHLRGTPATMQDDLQYADLRGEVYRWLAERTDAALADGIGEDRLLVDPGIGFGKSAEQSLELLTHRGEFRSLGYPVVVGASRKSFLGWAAGNEGAPRAARGGARRRRPRGRARRGARSGPTMSGRPFARSRSSQPLDAGSRRGPTPPARAGAHFGGVPSSATSTSRTRAPMYWQARQW